MMVSSSQQWCRMRWNQTTSVWSLSLMSTFPHLRPFLGMSAIFVRLIAQLSSTTSTQNSPVSTTLPLNSTTQLCCKFLDKHAPVSKRKVSVGKYSPWFSLVGDQLLTAKRHRRQAEQQRRTTSLTIHKLYNKAKHHVTKLVKKAKSVFLQHKHCSSSFEQRTLLHHQQTCRQNKMFPSTDHISSVWLA